MRKSRDIYTNPKSCLSTGGDTISSESNDSYIKNMAMTADGRYQLIVTHIEPETTPPHLPPGDS
jgi:hypothetical protein